MNKSNLAYKLTETEENAFKLMPKRKKESLVKQKVLGAITIIAGIIAPFILDGDITVTIFLVLLGLVPLTAKENILV